MVLLALWSRPKTPTTVATLFVEFTTIGTSLALLYLSHLEHLRSIRPSTILNGFLVFTLLLDLPRLRTLYFMTTSRSVTTLLAVSWFVKFAILILEAAEKRSLLKKTYVDSPIESTSGVLSRAVFWWLNSLLWQGSKAQLTIESLPALDSEIRDASIPDLLFVKWDSGMSHIFVLFNWTIY
jgi:hypothetical protein